LFYRVDYQLGVLIAGFIVGILFSRRTENADPHQVARLYYAVIATLLVLRTVAFFGSMLTHYQDFWNTAGGLAGDISSLLYGALFGLSARRKDARKLLTDPVILSALSMTLAFTFAIAGTAKAFSMTPMTEFFTQSGYSTTFLKFIVFAEVFGAIGLLLPWALAPALGGLTVDMFGAVVTHVRNGDPLNDSTGAIDLLIRLAVLGVLLILSSRRESQRTIRGAVLAVSTIGLVCLLFAVGGSVAMRHHTQPASISPGSHE